MTRAKAFGLFTVLSLFLVLSLAPEAFAQAQAAAGAAPAPAFNEIIMKMLPMFVVVFVVFHFMIIKPQKAKEQAMQTLLKGLKNGDSVITSSGIIGRVAGVTPEYVTLEVASGVKVKFEAAHIVKREGEQPKK